MLLLIKWKIFNIIETFGRNSCRTALFEFTMGSRPHTPEASYFFWRPEEYSDPNRSVFGSLRWTWKFSICVAMQGWAAGQSGDGVEVNQIHRIIKRKYTLAMLGNDRDNVERILESWWHTCRARFSLLFFLFFRHFSSTSKCFICVSTCATQNK